MSMKNKCGRIGCFYIMISAVAFGFMPLVTKIAYQHGSNPFTAAFGRFFFGSLILFMIIRLAPNQTVRICKEQLRKIILLSIPYAFTPILLYLSYHDIDTGLATTLHFSYPISVIILLLVFFKEKPTRKQMLCTMLCLMGLLFLYQPNGQVDLWGIALAVLSGVVYSFYIVFLGKSELKNISVFTIAFWLSLFAAAEIMVLFLPMGLISFEMDATGWLFEIVLAVLFSVTALVLFQKGLFLCGEVKTALFSTLEPLTGILVGILVFHEKLSASEILGMIFILLSIGLLVLKKRRNHKMYHEMRRSDRQITQSEAEAVLNQCQYGILSTFGEDGYPYGVPLSYVYADGKIYFHGAKDVGHKIENIKYQEKVCFTVVGDTQVLPDKFSTVYESVIVFGRVKLVENNLEALEKISQKYSADFMEQARKYAKASQAKVSVYAITVEHISGKARRK